MILFNKDSAIKKFLNKLTWKDISIICISFIAGIAWQNMWTWMGS